MSVMLNVKLKRIELHGLWMGVNFSHRPLELSRAANSAFLFQMESIQLADLD